MTPLLLAAEEVLSSHATRGALRRFVEFYMTYVNLVLFAEARRRLPPGSAVETAFRLFARTPLIAESGRVSDGWAGAFTSLAEHASGSPFAAMIEEVKRTRAALEVLAAQCLGDKDDSIGSSNVAELVRTFCEEQTWIGSQEMVVRYGGKVVSLADGSANIILDDHHSETAGVRCDGATLWLAAVARVGSCLHCREEHPDEPTSHHEVFLLRTLGGDASVDPHYVAEIGPFHDLSVGDKERHDALWQQLHGPPTPIAGVHPATVLERALEITDKTLELLSKGGKFQRDLFVETDPVFDHIWRTLKSAQRIFVVQGRAGCGKTSTLCDAVHRLRQEHGATVLFWSAQTCPQTSDFGAALARALGLSEAATVDEICAAVSAAHGTGAVAQLLVFIDGVDELPRYRRFLSSVLDILDRGDALPKMTIVLGMRDGSVADLTRLSRGRLGLFDEAELSGAQTVTGEGDWCVRLEGFKDSDTLRTAFNRYCSSYGLQLDFASLSRQQREVLRTPLVLRLVVENAARGSGTITELTLDGAIEGSIGRRLESRRNPQAALAIRAALSTAARHVLEHGPAVLVEEFLRELTGRLREQGIAIDASTVYHQCCRECFFIQHQDALCFGFTFDPLLEYMAGKVVLNQEARRSMPAMLRFAADALGRNAPDLVVGSVATFLRHYPNSIGPDPTALLEEFLRDVTRNGVELLAGLLGELDESMAGSAAARPLTHPMGQALLKCVPTSQVAEVAHVLLERMIARFARTEDGARGRDSRRIVEMARILVEIETARGDWRAIAEARKRLSDLYYEMLDDYAGAIRELRASEALFAMHQDELTAEDETRRHEYRYALACILSDSGYADEVREHADRCRLFIEQHDTDADRRTRRAVALSHFLLYMIDGDAAGSFRDSLPHLQSAEESFARLEDTCEEPGEERRLKQARARIAVNLAIAHLFERPEAALDTAREAVSKARDVDIQTEGYAQITLAAVCVQRYGFVADAEREHLLAKATAALTRAQDIFALTDEAYVHTLWAANTAVLRLIEGDEESARVLLETVVVEARDDFYNQFDAKVMLAKLAGSVSDLSTLLAMADKAGYLQGALHVHWSLWAVTGAEQHRIDARAIAKQLHWGDDPWESLRHGYYAGVFI